MRSTLNIKIRHVFSFTALILSFLMLFSSCSAVVTQTLSISDYFSAESAGNEYHTTSSSLKLLYESDGYSFYIDTETFGICVLDRSENYTFYSLLYSSNDYAYVLAVSLVSGNVIYDLNSQDNSVALSLADYVADENSATVSYELRPSSDSSVYVKISVVYTFYSSRMQACVDCSSIEASEGAIVASISFLPYFGAQSSPGSDDYFLTPDGSGAVLYTAISGYSLSFDIYGSDDLASNDTSSLSIMPLYGVKTNSSAFAAYINKGSAIATVSASSVSSTESAHIGVSFALCDYELKNNSMIISDEYDGEISIEFSFLTGSSANYSGMATTMREMMIEDGLLSSQKLDDDSFPFVLSINAYSRSSLFSSPDVVTFDRTKDILSLLKGKSIGDITLILSGIYSGNTGGIGLYSSSHALSVLGGKNGLAELYEYTSSNSISMYLDFDIISSGGSGLAINETAETISGGSLSLEISDSSIAEYSYTYTKDILSLNRLASEVQNAISVSSSLAIDGIRLTDIGSMTYSDYNTAYVSRAEAQELLSSACASIGSALNTIISVGNFYSIRNAELITDMPAETAYEQVYGEYEAVPVAQMILHGTVYYCLEPINLADSYTIYFLKCIEYGALPYFIWNANEESSVYYGLTLDLAAEYYEEYADILGDLTNSTIVLHEKLEDGVVMVKYDTGAEIYINYNNYSVLTSNNITVLPYSYVRVD